MNTDINEAFARLGMLEFAVEVILTNQLVRLPQSESDKFKKDFVLRFSSPILPSGPISSEGEQNEAWIVDRSKNMALHLIEKICEREYEIREKISREGQNQP